MPQLTPIKAFTNTPVSKYLIGTSAVSSVMLLVFYLKQYGTLALNPHILDYGQYWRIFTVQISVSNESDLILCTLLWFHFKTLERFFGLAKYAALVGTFVVYNAVVTFVALCVGQLAVLGAHGFFTSLGGKFAMSYFDTVFNTISPGPLAVLLLLYICHGCYIPVLYTFRVLLRRKEAQDETETGGVYLSLTNHFQIHALYALLLLNHGFSSFLPCFVGAVIGRLYTQNLLLGSGLLLELSARVLAWHNKVVLQTGYVSLSRSASPNEDEEIPIDDLAQPPRSATPPRPLRRQFLDTFLP